jgi:hypothetical protein
MFQLFAVLCLLLVDQVQAEDWRREAIGLIQPGVVVARRGLDSDPITQAILRHSAEGRWSHVGVGVQLIPDGSVYILSAMPKAGTRLEKPEEFFSEKQATDGAVFYIPSDKSEAVQSFSKEFLGRPFDDDLSLTDEGKKVYCTELVAVALKKAGVIDDYPLKKVPFFKEKVIMPDDLIEMLSDKREQRRPL